MDSQLAHVYVLGERLFALPVSKTDVGVWAGLDDPTAGTLNDNDANIGELVDTALERSRAGLRHPDRDQLNHLLDPLLKLAGVRRAGDFHRQAGLVSVERRGQRYRVARAKKIVGKGTTRTWFGEDAITRDLVGPAKAELGAVVRELAIASETIRSESRAR